jgi:hypothetical protein
MKKLYEYKYNKLILYEKIPFPSSNKKCDNQHSGWWQRKEPTPTVHKIDILPTPSHTTFLKTFAGFTTVVNQNKKF